MRLTVATFNIHNDGDRYERRKPLLVAAFCALDASIVALQEVRIEGDRQDDLLIASAPSHAWRGIEAPYGHRPGYGIATLVRADPGQVLAREVLPLSHGRVAQRVLLALPEMKTLWFANTHLYHRAGGEAERAAQAESVARWMLDAPAATAMVVAGDFNAPPGERATEVMAAAGFRSAFGEATGGEPPFGHPSLPGSPPVDYVWLHGDARAVAARTAAGEPSPDDPTLYASDHLALVVTLDL